MLATVPAHETASVQQAQPFWLMRSPLPSPCCVLRGCCRPAVTDLRPLRGLPRLRSLSLTAFSREIQVCGCVWYGVGAHRRRHAWTQAPPLQDEKGLCAPSASTAPPAPAAVCVQDIRVVRANVMTVPDLTSLQVPACMHACTSDLPAVLSCPALPACLGNAPSTLVSNCRS